jgi:protoporphyrinogen oxidase
MGQEAWQVIWEPLFQAKFARFKDQINMAWFWARVHPRSAQLGYVKGGFKRLAELIVQRLKKAGVHSNLLRKCNKLLPMKIND